MYEPLYYYVLARCTEWNTEGKQFPPESEAFRDFVWRTYTQVRKVQTHFAVLDASFSDFEISVCEGLRSFLHPREAEPQQERDQLLKIVKEELKDAEWMDKIIYPVEGEAFQNWKISIYLPVPVNRKDKSPEAALESMLAGSGKS